MTGAVRLAVVGAFVLGLSVPATAAGAPGAGRPGYAIVTGAGEVGTFGGAGFVGDLATDPPRSPVVGMAATPDGRGYWLAERDGAVLAFGDARGVRKPVAGPPTVAIAADPATGGYFTLDAAGGIHPVHAPAVPGPRLPAHAGPAVALATSGLAGHGVWVATADGTVVGAGAVPAITPPAGTRDVTAIAATPDGGGYWLLTAAGRVVAAGDATPLAAAAAPADRSPAVAFVPTPDGRGGLVVRRDGSVAPLGDASWDGDASSPMHPPLYPEKFQLGPTDAVGGAYLAAGRQPAQQGPYRVTFLGDSLSVVLGRYTRDDPATRSDDLWASVGGILGCGVTGSLELADYSNHRPLEPTLPACADWLQQYRRSLALAHPDAVVVLLGFWECQRHLLPHHGRVTIVSSAPYRAYLQAQLRKLGALVRGSGARLVLLTAPYFGDGTPRANVDAFNHLLLATVPDARTVDLTTLLDPQGRFTMTVNGVRVRTSDRVHLTRAAVVRLVDPQLLPALQAVAPQAR